ncbi:hypothetical protein ACFR97_04665 [Haloplanus litoreus]|uniref:hypothetical protein n=1 Tax=Haloplanus litoreus TaxID=767515 RepID=UPI003628D887
MVEVEPVTMSLSEPTSHDAPATESVSAPQDALRAAACYATLPVRFVAFWLAVLLPLTYLPLLATGVMTGHLAAFAGLFGLNAVAFVVGHSYNQPV